MGITTEKKVKRPRSAPVAVTAAEPAGSSATCQNCGIPGRSRRRTFSEQAWTVLLLWNEINPAAVDQPICDDCYSEMREILIDRNDEIESAMQGEEVEKIRRRLLNLAG